MRKRGFLIAGLVVASALVAVPALGHDTEFQNRVTLRYALDEFSGRVVSQKAACVNGRSVRVIQDVEGGDNVLVGVVEADDDGIYEVAEPDPADGMYFARIREVDLSESADHNHVCPKDRSAAIVIKTPPAP